MGNTQATRAKLDVLSACPPSSHGDDDPTSSSHLLTLLRLRDEAEADNRNRAKRVGVLLSMERDTLQRLAMSQFGQIGRSCRKADFTGTPITSSRHALTVQLTQSRFGINRELPLTTSAFPGIHSEELVNRRRTCASPWRPQLDTQGRTGHSSGRIGSHEAHRSKLSPIHIVDKTFIREIVSYAYRR
jgi:hypothetical protein